MQIPEESSQSTETSCFRLQSYQLQATTKKATWGPFVTKKKRDFQGPAGSPVQIPGESSFGAENFCFGFKNNFDLKKKTYYLDSRRIFFGHRNIQFQIGGVLKLPLDDPGHLGGGHQHAVPVSYQLCHDVGNVVAIVCTTSNHSKLTLNAVLKL